MYTGWHISVETQVISNSIHRKQIPRSIRGWCLLWCDVTFFFCWFDEIGTHARLRELKSYHELHYSSKNFKISNRKSCCTRCTIWNCGILSSFSWSVFHVGTFKTITFFWFNSSDGSAALIDEFSKLPRRWSSCCFTCWCTQRCWWCWCVGISWWTHPTSKIQTKTNDEFLKKRINNWISKKKQFEFMFSWSWNGWGINI